MPQLAAALDRVAARALPFELRTSRGGGRVGQPRRGGLGVAWLGLDRGADEAASLATTLSRELGTGDAWPAKGHAPHLTVARRATRNALRTLETPGAVPAVAWMADRIVLFESHLGPGNPRYEPLHVAMLGGSARG